MNGLLKPSVFIHLMMGNISSPIDIIFQKTCLDHSETFQNIIRIINHIIFNENKKVNFLERTSLKMLFLQTTMQHHKATNKNELKFLHRLLVFLLFFLIGENRIL